jgi:DTW domain-containing protein YfiP
MNVATYKLKKAAALVSHTNKRIKCTNCLQPSFSCFCELIKPFDPQINFVILIHPIEIARRITTGRMSHLCLKNSSLISGEDFSLNKRVNAILTDPNLHCAMLYPGKQSVDLGLMNAVERKNITPSNKKLTVFVIDGTWNTARKTVHLSQNLRTLPRICFTPSKPSRFRVRKQPRPECYSTIEAIHETIDLLNIDSLSTQNREHDHLLYVFEKMVARQIELAHSQTLTPWSLLPIPPINS